MKNNRKLLIIFILVPIILGGVVGLITVPGANIKSIIPAWVFPVVWTILYTLMGISSYLIYRDYHVIPRIYIIQLIVNYLWVFIFFTFKAYILGFITLLILLVLVILMIINFYRYNKTAAYLQIPYLIWLLIALYLNSTFL